MTNDLISRDALLKELDISPDEWAKGRTISAIIVNAPDVDAVPVVHGRWTGNYHSHCSVCDCFDTNAYIGRYTNFCPNCGAKMDRECETGACEHDVWLCSAYRKEEEDA